MLGFTYVLDELDITSLLLSNFTFRVYTGYSKFVLLEILGSIYALRERQGGGKQETEKESSRGGAFVVNSQSLRDLRFAVASM